MNTYVWKVEQLITQDLSDFARVVTAVNYCITATDSSQQFSYDYRSRQPLTVDAGQINTYIQYADLTEAQVLTWVTDSLGPDQVQTLLARIDVALAEIVSQGTRVIRSRLPWDPNPPEGAQDVVEPLLTILMDQEKWDIEHRYN
jgi:hypothetical protein